MYLTQIMRVVFNDGKECKRHERKREEKREVESSWDCNAAAQLKAKHITSFASFFLQQRKRANNDNNNFEYANFCLLFVR